VFSAAAFFGGFLAAGQNSADQDIRQQLGTAVQAYCSMHCWSIHGAADE